MFNAGTDSLLAYLPRNVSLTQLSFSCLRRLSFKKASRLPFRSQLSNKDSLLRFASREILNEVIGPSN